MAGLLTYPNHRRLPDITVASFRWSLRESQQRVCPGFAPGSLFIAQGDTKTTAKIMKYFQLMHKTGEIFFIKALLSLTHY